MIATMMDVPLSLNHLLERAGTIFSRNTIVSRLPDKSLVRHSYGQHYRRTRAGFGAAAAGVEEGRTRRHAVLEPPCASGGAFRYPGRERRLMHTLNLRLAADEIGWIAADAEDRFLIVDDILPPLYQQFAGLHAFEKVIVLPFSGAPVPAEFVDYEQLLAGADPDDFEYARTTSAMPRRCATPRAPPAGPRAWSIRTARRYCTRWSAAWAMCGI